MSARRIVAIGGLALGLAAHPLLAYAEGPLPDAGDWFAEASGHSDWRYHESGCIVTAAGDVYTYEGDKPGQRADAARHGELYDGRYLVQRLGPGFVTAARLTEAEGQGLDAISAWLPEAATGKLVHKQAAYDAGEYTIMAWFRTKSGQYQAVFLAGDGDFRTTNRSPATARILARLARIARKDCAFRLMFSAPPG
jgi:hypothetical protein